MNTLDDLELFLAHADDQSPFLDRGLPPDAGAGAQAPALRIEARNLAYEGADPDDLALQRWGLVAPAGPEGDRLLSLIEPLRALRKEQQGGAEVLVYRVPPDLDEDATTRWISDAYELRSREADRPGYLLLLGDADRISLDFQRILAGRAFVGRLAFPSDQGYEAYVAKILAWERADASDAARALFYTARDGTAATDIGYAALMTPSLDHLEDLTQRGELRAKAVVPITGDAGAMLAEAARREPALLFTISHGLGAPRAGWGSPDEQRALQGAMCFGQGLQLTAPDLASKPFLPGGIWFYLSCYGAATPAASSYYPWLRLLSESGGYSGKAEAVLAGLPRAGQRPFIAALPQAALANPDGPLAVVGHSDLAWSYSFQDIGEPGQRSRAERFDRVFRDLMDGGRAGSAHGTLAQAFTSSAVELGVLDSQARASGAAIPDDPARARRRSNLWMRLQDLAGYILLGDPAARLPIRARAVVAARGSATAAPAADPTAAIAATLGFTPASAPGSAPAIETIEEAIGALLAGNEAPKAIAARYGFNRADLDGWAETYRSAGRAALKKTL